MNKRLFMELSKARGIVRERINPCPIELWEYMFQVEKQDPVSISYISTRRTESGYRNLLSCTFLQAVNCALKCKQESEDYISAIKYIFDERVLEFHKLNSLKIQKYIQEKNPPPPVHLENFDHLSGLLKKTIRKKEKRV